MDKNEIKDFEDLEIFKLAKDLANYIYDLTDQFPGEEKFGLTSQIRRAAISIFANIAEGHGRFHYKENIQFARQSRGSMSEVKSFIIFAMSRSYISEEEYNKFMDQYIKLQIKLNNYINSLRRRINDL